MKEKQISPEKTIVIDIKLTRGMVVMLFCILALVAPLTYLMLSEESVVASEIEPVRVAPTGMRLFYMTQLGYDGSEASTACEAGYHMASFWEIVDPSNLKYNTALGFGYPDSGSGPPSEHYGWVRTGSVNDTSNVSGKANCDGWSSDASSHRGTLVSLPGPWTAGWEDLSIWLAATSDCQWEHPTWCIED